VPDANALRQARHDRCKGLTTCPKCGAPPGRTCYGPVKRGNGHVYPAIDWVKEAERAGRMTGKTTLTANKLMGQMMSTDWGKELGGLHAARWKAEEDGDAVTRLGYVVRP
jgi:hypothetical protein